MTAHQSPSNQWDNASAPVPLFVRCPHSEGELIVLKVSDLYMWLPLVPHHSQSLIVFFKWTSTMRPPPHPSFSMLKPNWLTETQLQTTNRPVWFQNYILYDGLNNRLQWKRQERHEECGLSNHYSWKDLSRIFKKPFPIPLHKKKDKPNTKQRVHIHFPCLLTWGILPVKHDTYRQNQFKLRSLSCQMFVCIHICERLSKRDDRLSCLLSQLRLSRDR